MHGHGVLTLVTDTFDDINFAIVRPAWSSHPESRPNAAGASRHVLEIEDDKSMSVLFGTCNTNAVSPAPSSSLGGIGFDSDNAIGSADQAIGSGSVPVNIIYIAMGWVIFLSQLSIATEEQWFQTYSIKAEHGEEIVSAVVILEGIPSEG